MRKAEVSTRLPGASPSSRSLVHRAGWQAVTLLPGQGRDPPAQQVSSLNALSPDWEEEERLCCCHRRDLRQTGMAREGSGGRGE